MSVYQQANEIWIQGGWLMVPLAILALFIYYVALEIYLHLSFHFILKKKVYKLNDSSLEYSLSEDRKGMSQLIQRDSRSASEVKNHFSQIYNEYVPMVNRKIRFLAIIITTGPLIGLLGTVTGMLSTFDGMVISEGNKFSNVVEGISEALITTQTGLIISIPAMVLLSLIIQKRNALVRSINRLEKYNLTIVFAQKV
tara:strand:+ start:1399 stop:1989 length:591 start_codon:yes stop_codon:yes gene_type:complete